MMKIKKLFLLWAALLMTTIAFAQENTSLTNVLAKAKKENKLVFVDCYFTGCIPCEQMDKDVFPNPVVAKEMEKNFLLVKANIFTEKLGDTLKVKYILNGFPSFLVLNGDGQLITVTSGYKDPGDLINLLNEASAIAAKGKYLAGYSTKFNEHNYPTFYTTFAKTRKGINDEVLANYSKDLKDFKAENSLLPFLIARTSNPIVTNELLVNYKDYAALYGEEILQPVVDHLLQQKIQQELKPNATEAEFNSFLAKYEPSFPANRWRINLQTIGQRFLLATKKDTVSYLKLSIANPVLYQYHFNALYQSLIGKKQFNGQVASLFCEWANAIVTKESSLEIIQTAAKACQRANDKIGYVKFMEMAIERAKKYQMPYQDLIAQLKQAP